MKQVVFVLACIIAGFAGGLFGSLLMQDRSKSVPSEVLQAHCFELLDRQGRVISYWGIDKAHNTVLAFNSQDGQALRKDTGLLRPDDPLNQEIALGSLASGTGFFTLRGRDSKTRVRIYLSEYNKPYLFLEDETGVRVSLGHQQSDTPSPDDDDWALNFHPERASIGMFTRRDNEGKYIKGFLFINPNKSKLP